MCPGPGGPSLPQLRHRFFIASGLVRKSKNRKPSAGSRRGNIPPSRGCAARKEMRLMARFLEDVEREIRELGGVNALGPRYADCLSQGSHTWVELETASSPSARRMVRYCEDCKVVDVYGHEYWLVPPVK